MVRSPKRTKAPIEAKEKVEKEKEEREKEEKARVRAAWEGLRDPERRPQPIDAGRVVEELSNLQLHLRSPHLLGNPTLENNFPLVSPCVPFFPPVHSSVRPFVMFSTLAKKKHE